MGLPRSHRRGDTLFHYLCDLAWRYVRQEKRTLRRRWPTSPRIWRYAATPTLDMPGGQRGSSSLRRAISSYKSVSGTNGARARPRLGRAACHHRQVGRATARAPFSQRQLTRGHERPGTYSQAGRWKKCSRMLRRALPTMAARPAPRSRLRSAIRRRSGSRPHLPRGTSDSRRLRPDP